MMATPFSSPIQVCMNEFRMSTVATYGCSFASTMHVSMTDMVATVGEIESSLDMKSILLFPPATFLPFRVPSLFYLRKRWDSRIVFLYYLVN